MILEVNNKVILEVNTKVIVEVTTVQIIAICIFLNLAGGTLFKTRHWVPPRRCEALTKRSQEPACVWYAIARAAALQKLQQG